MLVCIDSTETWDTERVDRAPDLQTLLLTFSSHRAEKPSIHEVYSDLTDSAVQDQEEVAVPGVGVVFRVAWVDEVGGDACGGGAAAEDSVPVDRCWDGGGEVGREGGDCGDLHWREGGLADCAATRPLHWGGGRQADLVRQLVSSVHTTSRPSWYSTITSS